MEPAKKITERIIPRLRRGAFVTDEAAELGQLLVNALSFEPLYLRARIEIANANKGIKRLKRVVEARETKIALLELELERTKLS